MVTGIRSPAADETPLMTVTELAAHLGVSERWIYNSIRLRKIPLLKVGRHLRFDQHAIERWQHEQTDKSDTDAGADSHPPVNALHERPAQSLNLLVGRRLGPPQQRRKHRHHPALTRAEKMAYSRVRVATTIDTDVHDFHGVWALHALLENA